MNGDGLDDIFIGGASGQPGQLYLQAPGRDFQPSRQPAFEKDADFEDTALAFLTPTATATRIGSRLRRQPPPDGFPPAQCEAVPQRRQGFLQETTKHCRPPASTLPSSCRSIFDADGDLDLFVGSRSVPGQYGVPPRHFYCKMTAAAILKRGKTGSALISPASAWSPPPNGST
ncbi:MAG: hypothetical protein IPL27_26680 [Lewinellaceae bacterium]|nr:hypothetical protein [Lewinellaceae bacterium]